MSIAALQITTLRNITALSLECDRKINVIYGSNGSGKTSILEALNLLSTGKSFRSHIKSRLIQYNAENFTLFAKVLLENNKICPVGLEKSISDETRFRIQGEDVASIIEFARLIPIQLLHPHSYELLEGGSKPRRQFIDWGVFHVEPLFHSLWNNAQRLLKQRNAAIRSQRPKDEIQLWDADFICLAESLDEMRRDYVSSFESIFQSILAKISDLPRISIQFRSGWNKDIGLSAQLNERLNADRLLGYTYCGPHRADLKLSCDAVPVQDALSRGQQKLLVFALRFAQAQLLQQQTQKSTTFLIDDLPSELDDTHQARLFAMIEEMSPIMQFFLTGVHADSFKSLSGARMFHVEHGALLVPEPA